jgi:hypothetical protein
VNITCIRPHHFQGVVDWSDAQHQALTAFYRHFKDGWIEAILLDRQVPSMEFNEATINVIKRRLLNILDIQVQGSQLFCQGVFDITAGSRTIDDIAKELESAKVVVVDTSSFSG